MYDVTITLFNFHAGTGYWYSHVFTGVDFHDTKASTATQGSSRTDSSAAEMILHATKDKTVASGNAVLQYVGPKAYAALSDPSGYFTFKPETDFFVVGSCAEDPIDDDAYDEGLYNALNKAQDDVYMITAAEWFSLLPHFEIGGR